MEDTLAVIEREREECPPFYQWVPGWTAERHREEQRGEMLEKQRREWEIAQEDARQRRDDEREKDRRAFEERLQTQANSIQQSLVRTSLGGLAIAILAILASALIAARFNTVNVSLPENNPIVVTATVEPVDSAPGAIP